MAIESRSSGLEKIEIEIIDTSRIWLGSVVRGKREFTPRDLHDSIFSLWALEFRKLPDNALVPEEFVIPGSRGQIGLSFEKEYNNSTQIVGMRYSRPDGSEAQIFVGGGIDSLEHIFGVEDMEGGLQTSQDVPKDLGLEVAEELLVGLNYFDK